MKGIYSTVNSDVVSPPYKRRANDESASGAFLVSNMFILDLLGQVD